MRKDWEGNNSFESEKADARWAQQYEPPFELTSAGIGTPMPYVSKKRCAPWGVIVDTPDGREMLCVQCISNGEVLSVKKPHGGTTVKFAQDLHAGLEIWVEVEGQHPHGWKTVVGPVEACIPEPETPSEVGGSGSASRVPEPETLPKQDGTSSGPRVKHTRKDLPKDLRIHIPPCWLEFDDRQPEPPAATFPYWVELKGPAPGDPIRIFRDADGTWRDLLSNGVWDVERDPATVLNEARAHLAMRTPLAPLDSITSPIRPRTSSSTKSSSSTRSSSSLSDKLDKLGDKFRGMFTPSSRKANNRPTISGPLPHQPDSPRTLMHPTSFFEPGHHASPPPSCQGSSRGSVPRPSHIPRVETLEEKQIRFANDMRALARERGVDVEDDEDFHVGF